MRKHLLVTFSVAVFLGLIQAQTPTATPQSQQAIQSIVGIPAYATPAAQSKVNADMAKKWGTPQFGGENFGGWGTLNSYSASPEAYLGQVTANGVVDNTTVAGSGLG